MTGGIVSLVLTSKRSGAVFLTSGLVLAVHAALASEMLTGSLEWYVTVKPDNNCQRSIVLLNFSIRDREALSPPTKRQANISPWNFDLNGYIIPVTVITHTLSLSLLPFSHQKKLYIIEELIRKWWSVAQWLERRTRRDRKVVRISAEAAGEFSSPGSAFYADSYFGIRSTCTAVAHKRFRSSGGTRMHTTYVAWRYAIWCMVVWCTQTAPTERAAVSCGTSYISAISTPLRWIFKNAP